MEHPHPRHKILEHCSIVTHEQDRTFVILQRILESFYRLDVEMIGGLVQQEKIRATEHHHRQRDTGLLTTRE